MIFGGVCALLVGCSAPRFHAIMPENGVPRIAAHAFIMADDYALPYSLKMPAEPRAVVVSLHGFNDYRRAFEGFCSAMQKQSIACYAYDQRGFGETTQRGYWPQPGQLQRDLRQIVQLLEKAHPGLPLYVAGESMGGAVILTAFAEPSERTPVAGAILLAPAVWARHTQPWYQRFGLWLAVHTFPGWQPTGESLGIQASDNIEALRAMGRDPLVIKETRIDTIYGLTNLMDQALAAANGWHVPTLALYGKKDEVIPKLPTCMMLQAMLKDDANITVKLYEQGYHMLTRDLQAERVFEDGAAWIKQATRHYSSPEEVHNYCEATAH